MFNETPCLVQTTVRARGKMPLTHDEAVQISQIINPIFDEVVADYDFHKYPADRYELFQNTFSQLPLNNGLIEESLKWKWGYWHKDNYPGRQQQFVEEAIQNWQNYVNQNHNLTSLQTFNWWSNAFNRRTAYISVAYITHLIHHAEPMPIIDQHNYRAMGAFKGQTRDNYHQKKKPSNWNDIVFLKQFMQSLLPLLPGRGFSEFDRFLMMYGRNHAPR